MFSFVVMGENTSKEGLRILIVRARVRGGLKAKFQCDLRHVCANVARLTNIGHVIQDGRMKAKMFVNSFN